MAFPPPEPVEEVDDAAGAQLRPVDADAAPPPDDTPEPPPAPRPGSHLKRVK